MPPRGPGKCCRSTPACRRCPLRRPTFPHEEFPATRAGLVASIVVGRPRPLPQSVGAALASLALAGEKSCSRAIAEDSRLA